MKTFIPTEFRADDELCNLMRGYESQPAALIINPQAPDAALCAAALARIQRARSLAGVLDAALSTDGTISVNTGTTAGAVLDCLLQEATALLDAIKWPDMDDQSKGAH